MPTELGEGIDLPEAGISVGLEGLASQVAPSVIEESVAFYPNVATDTDFAVAPSPEWFRDPDGDPQPGSARLRGLQVRTSRRVGSEVGRMGAPTVEEAGEPVLAVLAPTAIDADGTPVPASLSTSGNATTVSVTPGPDTVYPVLVDPGLQKLRMDGQKHRGRHLGNQRMAYVRKQPTGRRGVRQSPAARRCLWLGHGCEHVPASTGRSVGVRDWVIYNITNAYAGGEDFFAYSVPRYDSDPFVYAGQEPESFISRLTVSDMAWIAKSEAQSPWVYMGIWGPVSGWGAEIYAHEGLEGHSVTNLPWVYNSATQPPWT